MEEEYDLSNILMVRTGGSKQVAVLCGIFGALVGVATYGMTKWTTDATLRRLSANVNEMFDFKLKD